MKTVQSWELRQPSTSSMLSFVVPTGTSRTISQPLVSPTCLRKAQLLGRQLLEAWDDARAGGDGQSFQLHAAHPAHRVDALLEEERVGLIVEA